MLFGSKARFAIEARLNEVGVEDPFLLGRFCFWVEEEAVGDYQLGGALSVALASCRNLLRFSGNRDDGRLIAMPAADAFTEIYSALFVDNGQSDNRVKRDSEYYTRFVAIPTGFDVFDSWMAFLIEDRTMGRYLWKKTASEADHVHETTLQEGEFDAVLLKFVNRFGMLR